MYKSEKSKLFWEGLVVFGLSATSLFASLWYPLVVYSNPYYWSYHYDYSVFKYFAPWIFGSLVFLFIGLYMMRNEMRKEPSKVHDSNCL